MYDFLIIGGGIAGISAAAMLAHQGATLVVEAEDQLAYHASGRSAAMFLRDYGNSVIRALNYASEDAHRAAGVFKPCPVMAVTHDPDDPSFEQDITEMQLSPITLDEALQFFPILNTKTQTTAAVATDGYALETDLCLQNYRKSAIAAGAEIRVKSPVSKIARGPKGWAVQTGDQTVQTKYIINAAGPWGDAIAQMAGIAPLGLQPFRRSMARMKAPGGLNTAGWAFTTGAGWYAKPDAGALAVSPFEADPMPPHDAYADDIVIAEGLERYNHAVTQAPTRPIATWAGLRTFTPDRALAIGPDPDDPDFFWLVGQGGYGFQTAPAAAALATARLTHADPPLPDEVVTALDPARFRR